jgi:hypothetical protein
VLSICLAGYNADEESSVGSKAAHRKLVAALGAVQSARRSLRWSYCFLYELPQFDEGVEATMFRASEISRELVIREQGALECVTECLQENLEALSPGQLFKELGSENAEFNELVSNSISLIETVSPCIICSM